MPRLRDRLLTPIVARAMTSPTAIVLAGVGASAAILVGAPAIGVVAAAGLAWGGRVALAVPRRSAPRIEARRLDEPWRSFVRGAVDARSRFDEAVTSVPPGPLRDRLTLLGNQIAAGVEQCWQVATRAQQVSRALGQLDTTDARARLAQLSASAPPTDGSDPDHPTDHMVEALRAQLATADRMARVAADAHAKLQLLDARLDEAVARAVELSIGASNDATLGGVGGDVDAVVGDLEALRQALEEAGGSPSAASA